MKSMKKPICTSWNGRYIDHKNLCCALLQYQNTPTRKDGFSPAHKLFGHPVQDTLPAHRCSSTPEWQRSTKEAEQQTDVTLQSSAKFYNTHAHTLSDRLTCSYSKHKTNFGTPMELSSRLCHTVTITLRHKEVESYIRNS